MMAQGLDKSRAAGGLGSISDAPPPGMAADQPGAIVSYSFCGYPVVGYERSLHMEEATPSSRQPRATRGRLAPPEKGDPSSHDGGANDRLGNGGIDKPMTIRLKQPDASSDVRQDRGGFVEIGNIGDNIGDSIGDSDNSHVSDTTTESDINSIMHRDGDRRRAFHDTDTKLEQDADEEQLRFAQCPYKGCAEAVLADEMALHIDLHTILEYQKMPICEVGTDAPIEDAYSDLPAGTHTSLPLASSFIGVDMLGSSAPSLAEYHDEPDKPAQTSPSHQQNDGRKKHRDDSTASYLSEKENFNTRSRHRSKSRRAQSLDGKHSSHRERRERHRSGRDLASPHSVQQSKHSSAHRKPLMLSSRPWWAVWAFNAPQKPFVANGKGKEVLADIKSTLSQPKRLGKAELGKYANEERMPDWLAVYLKKEWGVCHKGVIPVLKQLLEQSSTTEYAYLCDPCVQHVSRLPKEGGFCGYRNLQTVISYILGAQLPGYEKFGSDVPSVFDLQNYIEEAWDKGINTRGRIETGGIRWTRKYIGTPEAVTLFRSLGIPHTVRAFKHKKAERARDLMLREVEQYFQMGKYQIGHKVRTTTLPPIYWQHPGHSLTIVGIEKTIVGDTNLLVFDPIYREGSPIVRIVGRRRLVDYFPDKLLRTYRRGSRYLARYRSFEIIRLQPKPEDLAPVDFGH